MKLAVKIVFLFFWLLDCSNVGGTPAHRLEDREAASSLQADETCGTTRHRMRRHDRAVFPRRPPLGNKYGSALEFDGTQVVQYLKLRTPSKRFSVDFWMRPEGGQHNPAVVLRVYDRCARDSDSRGWFIGLREASISSDLRVTFALHSAIASRNTSIMSHGKVDVRRWIHVAATYDGQRMKLYVNQAKVAVGYGQKGAIFDTSTQGHACDVFEVGGITNSGSYYRGQVDKLRLWSKAISHKELTASIPENTLNRLMNKVMMYDDFDDVKAIRKNWIPTVGSYPRDVRSTVPHENHDLSIRKPPCGVTFCDNPEVIRSYVTHTDLRGHKRLKLRVVNVMDDDGRRPTVSEEEIKNQHRFIQTAFAPYNISWELVVAPIKDSLLLGRTVLHNCDTSLVGDGSCDDQCEYDVTGMDGGDCATSKRTAGECTKEKMNNGRCDQECNKGSYNWDNGACCKNDSSTPSKSCFDPRSPNRAYLSVNDYKTRVGLDNRDAVNVYVVNWRDKKLQGLATFPWDKAVHSTLGGVVIAQSHFREASISKVLVHELGHVLGLWHVHRGSETEMSCTSDCFESFPSLELGDLCSDTNPTVLNTKCGDPDPSQATCGLRQYKDTPFANYMSYANGSCLNNFTPQQVARMHCYIDLDYQSWQTDAKPSFVPLSPRITSANEDAIQLSWIPPLGSGANNAKNLCNECEDDKVLEQYATTAFSSTPSGRTGNGAPHQATGFPDADRCVISAYSWRPYQKSKSCSDHRCFLEVGFREAVVPTALTIWVSSQPKDAFSDIVLVFSDGSEESLGNGTAQCDSPYTRQVYVKKKVSKVRIHVSQNDVRIDAVKLTSHVGHPNCSMCKPLHYVINRDPPFDTGAEVRVPTTRYEDKSIYKNRRYVYKVRAVTNDGTPSPFSPPLIYKPQVGFCGNGKIDKGEECDDGNVRDGDGCNIQCQMEDVFHCEGRPSLCYRHDGDGVCEEFERHGRRASIRDCGFYTREGFRDQWVDRATASSGVQYNCPVDTVVGPPRPDLKCKSDLRREDVEKCDGWSPETKDMSSLKKEDMWLKTFFKRPVVASEIIIYLTYVFDFPSKTSKLKFELVGSTEAQKTTIEHTVTNFCKENPVSIAVHHDMTKPFFRTSHVKITFNTDEIGIAAIALRSPRHFDPVALQECQGNELYHPRTQRCRQYKCVLPECTKLTVSMKHAQKVKCKKGRREGDVCIVQCERGFTPVKPFEAICSGGKWLTDDGTAPKCTPVDCRSPKIRNAKISCPQGTTFGKKCFYKCEESTKQSGSKAEASVTCEEDGLWSATNLFCPKICRSQAIPPNSYSRSKQCNKGKPFVAGESCKYRCKNGFVTSGFSSLGYFKRTCMKDGTWSGPRCVPVRCPAVEEHIFRWYNCTSQTYFGSVCKLVCPNEKNNREIRCLADGKWDRKFQLCPTKRKCPLPVQTSKGLVINCNTNSDPGTDCELKCPRGFEPGIKTDSGRKLFNAIACSPMSRWYPDPGSLRCFVKCNEVVSSDFVCDDVNNNEECGWDGGDCCGLYPNYNPARCHDKCKCLDPDPDVDEAGSSALPM